MKLHASGIVVAWEKLRNLLAELACSLGSRSSQTSETGTIPWTQPALSGPAERKLRRIPNVGADLANAVPAS